VALSKIDGSGLTGIGAAECSFSIYRVQATAGAVNGVIDFTNTDFDVGSDTNGTYFLAPSNGKYWFNFVGTGCNSSGSAVAANTACTFSFEVSTDNGSTWTPKNRYYWQIAASSYPTINESIILNLNQNDRVRVNVTSQYVYCYTSKDQEKTDNIYGNKM